MTPGQAFISVSTIEVMPDGGALRAVDPDTEGVYRNVPLMLLDSPSRNKDTYDSRSAIMAMTDEKTKFGQNLRDGSQEGEFQHPFQENVSMKRSMFIDRTMVSHFISTLDFKKMGSYTIVFGDVHPWGPYGEHLRSSFANPHRNTSFSARALCSPGPGGINIVRVMITFDSVSGSGFREASKRYLKQEDLQDNLDEIRKLFVAEESIRDQEILDLFQTNEVSIRREAFELWDTENGILKPKKTPFQRTLSARHLMIREMGVVR